MTFKWNIFIALAVASVNFSQIASTDDFYKSMKIIVTDPASLFQRKLLFYGNYKNTSNAIRYYFNDLVNYVLLDMEHMSYKILFQMQKTFRKTKTLKVVLLEDIEAFRYFYQKIYDNGNYNLSFNLMFISTITSLDTESLTAVFGDLFSMSILNVALIVQLAKDHIVMVTYFPFTSTSCYSIKPVIINRYDTVRQQWTHTNYFPPKTDNFYGCPITCATWDDRPYRALERHQASQRISKYDGFEGKLLEYVAEKLNFTTNIYIMNEEEISETFNESGLIFGKIFSKSADIALGGFFYKSDLDHSAPYSQTNYYYLSATYLVTNVLNVYSTYEKIAYPFQLWLWYAIGIILALSSLVIYACGCSRRIRGQRNFIIGATNTNPQYYLYTLALGAGMPSTQLPKYNFARFLFTCWMLATLVLRSAYQSGMYQMLRDNKHRNLPQTIADVLADNYVILLQQTHKGVFRAVPNIKNVRTLNESVLKTFPELEQVDTRTAIVTNYEYFGYFGKVNVTSWRNLHLVKERIYTQQLAMNVRRHSYLVDPLNDQIANAQTFGFVTHWRREFFGEPSEKNNVDHDAEMGELKTLSMNELGAVFMILLWAHLVAVGVFITEIMWNRFGEAALKILRRH